MYQHMSACGYSDQIRELRNTNSSLLATNKRLSCNVRLLESELQRVRAQLAELKQIYDAYNDQSLRHFSSLPAQALRLSETESEYERRCQKLLVENTKLRMLLHGIMTSVDYNEITDSSKTEYERCLPTHRNVESGSKGVSPHLSRDEDTAMSSVLLSPRVIMGGLDKVED